MIKRDYLKTRKDGIKLYRIYSDINKYIIQQPTGIEYTEAVDVENAPYYYIESDKEIEQDNGEPIK